MSESHIELRLGDSTATEALGRALARAYVAAGRGSAVIYLYGELGAGKTTCVRSLLRALGVDGLIRSPTYTLVEAYTLGAGVCVHVDLYRIHGPPEVDELGLRDYCEGECLMLVEWPENGVAALPSPDIELTLTYLGDARHCSMLAPTTLGRRWLANLVNDSSLGTYVSNLT